MALKLITAPTNLAVDLADAKLQCRVSGSDEDALLTRLIRGAVARGEHQTGRAFVDQEWEVILDAFPVHEIELAKPPQISVTSVTYLDTTGVQQTLSPSAYALDADVLPGWLFPAAGTSWPATLDAANAVRIRFRCGYGADAAAVPEGIRDWLLVQVSTLYDNRDAVALAKADDSATSFASHMLDPFRTYA